MQCNVVACRLRDLRCRSYLWFLPPELQTAIDSITLDAPLPDFIVVVIARLEGLPLLQAGCICYLRLQRCLYLLVLIYLREAEQACDSNYGTLFPD